MSALFGEIMTSCMSREFGDHRIILRWMGWLNGLMAH